MQAICHLHVEVIFFIVASDIVPMLTTSIKTAYILHLCEPTDFKLTSKAQMLLVFIRDGCFNNSTHFTSDVTSFIEGISTN